MTRLAIVAAGGNSKRTGLGEYTTKAALPLHGRPLLSHQLDFLHRSEVNRVFIICRPEHAQLLGSRLSPEERKITAFVLSDCATGWAGELERASAFVNSDDEVLLISCDNLHEKPLIRGLGPETDAYFTYTHWANKEHPPTFGPVLAKITTAWGNPNAETWIQRPGVGFTGDLFTGYAMVRGGVLANALRDLPHSERGEKEFTSLLEILAKSPRCRAYPYPGTYMDIADVADLTRLDWEMQENSMEFSGNVELGAGILIYDCFGAVLFTERSDGLGWCLPGGVMEPGERFIKTAIRETKEEIGLTFQEKNLRLLGVYPTQSKINGPAATVVFYGTLPDPERSLRESFAPLNYLKLNNEVKTAAWLNCHNYTTVTIPFNLKNAVDDFYAKKELDCR